MKIYSPGTLKLVEVRTYEGIFDGHHQWEFNGYTIVECCGHKAVDINDGSNYQMIEILDGGYSHNGISIDSVRVFPSSISREFNKLSDGFMTSYQINEFMKKNNFAWVSSPARVLKKNR